MSLHERGALSVKETAQYLSLGRTTIYALISSGELATIKQGSRRLIAASSVQAWLEANTTQEGSR